MITCNLLLASTMGVVVYMINFVAMGAGLKLLVQCAVGVAVYVLLSLITRNSSFHYILSTGKRYILKKR